ncbi:MAG: acetylxylan esterase [Bacteroidales bacterium]|nr:acetylxylan esterase [Bacteroidales bacterium]
MKRVLFIALLLAAACTVKETPATVQEGESASLSISIADLASKTAYTPDAGALKCSWSAGDVVSVLSIKDGKVVAVDNFTTTAGGRTATFQGRFTGAGSDSQICFYPSLSGGQKTGYFSEPLPGSKGAAFGVQIGDDKISYYGLDQVTFSQPTNADASHIAWSDIMTGAADIAHPENAVSMTKHSDVLALSLSIPDLEADEKVGALTVTLSNGAPFAQGTATLPLASSGLWTASTTTSSLELNYGPYSFNLFRGLSSGSHSLTTYIPIIPLSGASSLQGDQARELSLYLRTDRGIYEATKTIPAHTGGEYLYAFSGGKVDGITATLAKTSTVGTPTGTCEPNPGLLFFDKGPYTLNTTVNAKSGSASFKLVRDVTLLTGSQEIVVSTTTNVGTDGSISVPLGNLDPGFYQVRLRDTLKFFIGVRPDAVYSPTDAKPDFDSFWQSTFAELDAQPWDVQLTKIDSYSSSKRECYEVRYKSLGGVTVGGILSIPVAAGKYPVKLKFLGYGNTHTYYSPDSNPGLIEFEVSTRDQGLFKTGSYWDCQGIESKETYYYRGAYCDVKRAIDYVLGLEKADLNRVVAWGSSQGGALTYMAAALDSRIKAIAPSVPFLSDFPDYWKIVSWPMTEMFNAASSAGMSREQLLDMLSYFDVKNFAPKITCPVYMTVGLQDGTCPPHINFAIYNNLGSTSKQYLILPYEGHSVWGNSLTNTRVSAFLKPFLQ